MLALATFQSCEKDDATDEGVAPELPPVESFIMPFDGFEDADTTGLMTGGGGAQVRTTTFFNWFHSATNIVVWNTVLTINLVVPVASFYEAFNHNATYEGNGVWRWAYSFSDNVGGSYQAKLFGEILSTNSVQWDMYISKDGGFQDVHWYAGTTTHDGNTTTTANWTLNHQPNNPEAFIQIDYEQNDGNDIESIRYSNIIPANQGNGDYIEFRKGEVTDTDYDRAYNVLNNSESNLLEINWSELNKNGRVKDENRFGDTDWHCWDVDLMDMICL